MKLRLPNKLIAAMMAAASPVLFSTLSTATLGAAAVVSLGSTAEAAATFVDATTTIDGTEYAGYVITYVPNGTSTAFHEGSGVVYATASDGVAEGTVVSRNASASSPVNQMFWYYFANGGSVTSKAGNTLRLDGATGDMKLDTQFSDVSLGGIITTASESAHYIIGRINSNAGFRLEAKQGAAVNMDLQSDVTLASGTSAYAINNGGTWKIAAGKTLTFSGTGNTTVAADQTVNITGGGEVVFSRNVQGTGTLNVASGSTLTFNAAGSTAQFTAAGLAGGGLLKIAGGTVTVGGTNNSTFAGDILVTGQGSVLAFGGGNNGLGVANTATSSTRVIKAENGGVIDLNGKKDNEVNPYNITLGNGGKLRNTGDTIGNGSMQLANLTVTSSSSEPSVAEVGGTNFFALLGSGWGATKLNLNGNTLRKTDDNTFALVNTTVTAGTIDIHQGTLSIGGGSGNSNKNTTADETIMEFSGGTLQLYAQLTARGLRNADGFTGNGTIAGPGTIVLKGRSGDDFSYTGSLGTSAAKVNITTDSTHAGTQTLNLTDGSAINTLHTHAGTLKINASGTVTVAAMTLGSQNNSNSNLIVGGSGVLNLTGNMNSGWGFSHLTVDGTFRVDGTLGMATGNRTNYIDGAGTINTNALQFGNIGYYEVSTSRVNIGSGGIIPSDNGSGWGRKMVGTTLGALDDWNTALGLELVNTVTFDTGNAETTENDGAGHTITLNGALSGSGNLVKSGAGTLVLGATNTATGSITVNEGTLKLAGAWGNYDNISVNKQAGKTAEIILSHADSAATVLQKATGNGDVTLLTNALLEGGNTPETAAQTQMTGTLTVGSGSGSQVTLRLGDRREDGGAFENHYANLSSFSSVVLDKGRVWFRGTTVADTTPIRNLTVTENGGEIYIHDTQDAGSPAFRLGGLTTVNGTLTLAGKWKHNLEIERLTGADGTVNITSGNDNHNITIKALQDTLGTLSIGNNLTVNLQASSGTIKNTTLGAGTLNISSTATLSSLTINGGTVNLTQGGAKNTQSLGDVTINGGTIKNTAGAESMVRNIKSLAVGGDATLAQDSWNTFWNIGALNKVGETSAEHTLTWNMTTTHYSDSVLSLTGEGDFDGTFHANRTDNPSTNGYYQAQVEIADQNALKNAVLKATGTGESYMTVALNADKVNLAGLQGNAMSILMAGAANKTTGSNTESGKQGNVIPESTRTTELIIHSKDGAEDEFAGKVLGGISITKEGAGTQTFSGDMSAFDGNISAKLGNLNLMNLGSAAGFNVNELFIKDGATVSGYTGAAIDAAQEATINVTGTLKAESGANLNANLTFSDGAKIDVAGENGLHMGSSVTFTEGNGLLLTGTAADMLASFTLTGQQLTLFSGVDSFTVGSDTYSGDVVGTQIIRDFSSYINLTDTKYDNVREHLVLKFDVEEGSTDGGVVSLWMETPEPATATLSLLALAALASRRKRK